ncbi:MAG: hypothetical protein ABSE54_04340, partial [Smithella sp.]
YELGDIYIDANENGQWDTDETYIALNLGTLDCLTRPAGTALPSYYSDVPSKQGTCSGLWDQNSSAVAATNYVRRSQVMILSDSFARISDGNTVVGDGMTGSMHVAMGGYCVNDFSLWLMDRNGNPMPAGTTITTANNDILYTPYSSSSPPSSTQALASISVSGGSPVNNSTHAGVTPISFTVSVDCTAGTPQIYPTGSADLVVTTPKGNVTFIGVTITK